MPCLLLREIIGNFNQGQRMGFPPLVNVLILRCRGIQIWLQGGLVKQSLKLATVSPYFLGEGVETKVYRKNVARGQRPLNFVFYSVGVRMDCE